MGSNNIAKAGILKFEALRHFYVVELHPPLQGNNLLHQAVAAITVGMAVNSAYVAYTLFFGQRVCSTAVDAKQDLQH